MKTLQNVTIGVFGFFLLMLGFSSPVFSQDDPQYTDPEIASIAVTANQIDVNYADIALKKSENENIRRFAQTMKDDHNAVIKMAVDLATKLGVTPADNDFTQSLLKGEKEMTKKLKKASKAEFDKIYIDNEVAYHEAVINAVKSILIPQTDNAELKELLVKVAPTLQTHLEHAQMVQKEYQ